MNSADPSSPENKPCCDKLRVAVYAVGIGGALLLMLFLVWMMYRYNRPSDVGREARAAERKKALTEIKAASANDLETYGWVIKDKVARIPIDTAMEQSVQLWANPTAARSNLISRAERAYPAPEETPAAPEGSPAQ